MEPSLKIVLVSGSYSKCNLVSVPYSPPQDTICVRGVLVFNTNGTEIGTYPILSASPPARQRHTVCDKTQNSQ